MIDPNEDKAVRLRCAFYSRGLGHGATGRAYQAPDNADYMAGWKRGAAAIWDEYRAFCAAVGHDPTLEILR